MIVTGYNAQFFVSKNLRRWIEDYAEEHYNHKPRPYYFPIDGDQILMEGISSTKENCLKFLNNYKKETAIAVVQYDFVCFGYINEFYSTTTEFKNEKRIHNN